MTCEPDARQGIVVDSLGVLARWAQWQERAKQKPLAAMAEQGSEPVLFVANEVLADPRDPSLIQELVAAGGVRVERRPLLPAPPEISREFLHLAEEFPMPVRLRFASPPPLSDGPSLLRAALDRAGHARESVFTSPEAASIAALVSRYAAEGRDIGLNTFAQPLEMPLQSAAESPSQTGGINPFAWSAFSGSSQITRAWQLVESYRAVRSLKPAVYVAILDGGFWLDGAGRPMVPPGQAASDFGGGVLQVNLLAEGSWAGGSNPNKCGGGSTCNWHGNQVASAAVAAIGNNLGAAGAGGSVALPAFFRTNLSVDQIFRCLQYCTAWSLDVLNMSFSLHRSEAFFGTSAWNKAFQFAADHGVILITGAGNDNEELPDYNVRPATRTPGTTTVGSLDNSNNKSGFSNYGSSVNIWAPGEGVPVAPDGDNPNGSLASGTSIAAPIVAGVAAMMRAVNPGLNTFSVRQILSDTGWTGSGSVSKRLNAHAAVLAAMGGRLPDDYGESNDSPANASELLPSGPGGALQPIFGGFATRPARDTDYWKFSLTDYTQVTATLEWYPLLGGLSLSVEADDPDNHAPSEMARSSVSGSGKIVLSGLLPPGLYRVLVRGSGETAYKLLVDRKPGSVAPDQFEANDSFDQAANLRFKTRDPKFGILWRREWGPGSFQATIHSVWSYLMARPQLNPDYYRFEVPAQNVFSIPVIHIANTDRPLDLTLYNEAREVIGSWIGVRQARIVPPAETICFLKVECSQVNRYTIRVFLDFDRNAVPNVWQEVDLLPHWWVDPPPYRMAGLDRYFVINAGQDRGDGENVSFFAPRQPLQIELLNLQGERLREGTRLESGALSVSTAGLTPGQYAVRIRRLEGASGAPLRLRVAPPVL